MNICRICTGDVETDVELANQQEVGMQVGRRVEQAPDLEMRILVQMLQTRLQGVALPRDWVDFEMLNAFVQTVDIFPDGATAQYFERMTFPWDWLQAFNNQ